MYIPNKQLYPSNVLVTTADVIMSVGSTIADWQESQFHEIIVYEGMHSFCRRGYLGRDVLVLP